MSSKQINQTRRKTNRRNKKSAKSTQPDYLSTIKINAIKIRKSIYKFLQSVIKKSTLLRQYLDYYFEYYKFLVPKVLRYHSSVFFNKNGFKTFSVFYFIILAVAILTLGQSVNLSIDRNIATTFLFGAAAMVGGALAIITSFSLFTLQNAAGHLPRGFYTIATDNKKYTFIFFGVGVISIILFGGGLSYGLAGLNLSAPSIQFALFLIGLVFYLIYVLYRIVRSDVNPNTTLSKATKQALTAVEEIYKRTAQFSKVILKHPKNRENITQEQTIASIFQSAPVQEALNDVNFRLTYLFDYHDSLVATQQRSSALEVLDHVRAVLLKYLHSRKDNSLAIPEPEALMAMTSDSKYFLQPNLERLMSIGENYIREQDTNGIMRVVNLFINLAESSAEIKYLGMRQSENPILEQIRGYFDQFMKRAIALNSLEGTFQGLRFYRAIGRIAVEKHLHLELNSLYRSIWEIASNAIKNRYEPVLGEVFKTDAFMINKLIASKYPYLEQELSNLFRHLQDVTFFSYLLVSAGSLRDNLFTQTDIAKPFKETKDLVFTVVRKVTEVQDLDEKAEWQDVLLITVDELRQVLRDLAQKLKNANHILILSFGQIIAELGMLLIELSQDAVWVDHKRKLETEVGSYLYLPHWFMYEITNVEANQSFDSLIEAVAQMGLLALQKNMISTSQEAIKVIFQFANDMLTKELPEKHYGFTEPRIVEYACYIGILALKLNKQELVQGLKTQIQAFEQVYFQNHFSNVPDNIDIQSLSPSPDQLKRELLGLVDNRNRWQYERWGLRDAREMFFGLINTQDIEAFIAFVWPDEGGSSIDEN